MVYYRFMGGLGNQMFQFAYLLNIKNKVKIDLTHYSRQSVMPFVLSEVFPKTSASFLNSETKETILYKIRRRLYPRISEAEFDIESHYRYAFIEGYWQGDKYIHDIESLKRYYFNFENVPREVREYGERISSDEAIGIHIRGGDYLNNLPLYGNICTREYYQFAMDYVRAKSGNGYFLVFTDDETYASTILGGVKEYRFSHIDVEGWKDWYDMYLMTKCRHLIIANSSFSWWAARLGRCSEGITVMPATWDNQNNARMEFEGCIRMSGNGTIIST